MVSFEALACGVNACGELEHASSICINKKIAVTDAFKLTFFDGGSGQPESDLLSASKSF